jgi:hypothetical protein
MVCLQLSIIIYYFYPDFSFAVSFFIYRRHKKHDLGSRLLSLFYIDGMNAKSIGNILCIIGIVITILGLIYPWYTVTANVSIPQYTETGSFNAISVDGLNGIQVRLPDRSGPVPLGTFALPFYVLIGIGLVFLVLATIGISTSKKLGKKYLSRGIRLVMYFILILGLVMAIGSIVKMTPLRKSKATLICLTPLMQSLQPSSVVNILPPLLMYQGDQYFSSGGSDRCIPPLNCRHYPLNSRSFGDNSSCTILRRKITSPNGTSKKN